MTSDPPPRANPSRLALDLASRVDVVCDRFEGDWRAGLRPRIEDYLSGEDPAVRPALFHELLAVELEHRTKLGERPAAFDYLERFADLAATVGRLVDEFGGTRDGSSGLGLASASERAASLLPSTFEEDFPRTPAPGASGPVDLPTIPGYEILGELGRGGMGVVYQAREVRLNRIVAIKMILAGAHASSEAAVRFLNEAEVVARLRHPNVVQIFAMGDHDGRPFLELEYLEGGNLARSLDGNPRPAGSAAAFVEVLARAVHEAHRRGVIHRDLKPSNVLLTADGHPKIADFGLAKAVDSDSGLTGSDSVLGSPSYMAPEQADGRAKSAGVAADVYALGAIFYEMLTGRPPFRASTALATLELVRNVEAVAPSRFQPDLPRDAETICLKCLEKDPARRYPTAEALADDLRRYLEGHPITARRLGPAGRFRRWCAREPRVAALLLAVAVTSACGFIGVTWSWRRAEAEAVAALADRKTAVRAQAKAEANFQKARDLVEDLTKLAGRLSGRPEMVKTRREILEKVVVFHASFLEEKSDDPAVLLQSARAYRSVALIRGGLGQRDPAREAYERSASLFERLVARDPADPVYRTERAWSHFYVGLFRANSESDPAGARDSYEKAIAIQRRLVDESPGDPARRSALALFLLNSVSLRVSTEERGATRRALDDIIALYRGILTESPGNVAARENLALALDESSSFHATDRRYEAAEQASRESISLVEGILSERPSWDHLRAYLYRYQDRLAYVLQSTGRNEEAEVWRGRSFAGLKDLSGTFPDVVGYRSQLAVTAAQYGLLIDTPDRHDDAVPVYSVALDQRRKLAEIFPGDAAYLNQYAWALVTTPDESLRDPARAMGLAKRAVAIEPESANYWNTLGMAHLRAGDYPAARSALGNAVRLRKGGDASYDWLILAMVCWKAGDRAEARKWYDKAAPAIVNSKTRDDEAPRVLAEAKALLDGTDRGQSPGAR